MGEPKVLGQLAFQFAIISLIAIGGATSVLPEMHRMVVDNHQWMDSSTFADLFALAQTAPGPNVMVVTLIGWQVAGFAGALVTTVAMVLPAFCLTFTVSRFLPRWRRTEWYRVVEKGLAPLTVGLVLAGAYLLTAATVDGVPALIVTVATVAYIFLLKRNPLYVLIIAAAAGATGLI